MGVSGQPRRRTDRQPQPPQTHVAATALSASGSLIWPTHHCLRQLQPPASSLQSPSQNSNMPFQVSCFDSHEEPICFSLFQQVVLVLELISEAVGILVGIVILLQQLIRYLHQIISMAHDGFQRVVSVLELIDGVVGSLVKVVVLFLRLKHICRRIWSILTAGQPVAIANDYQNEVPLADAEADAANGQDNIPRG